MIFAGSHLDLEFCCQVTQLLDEKEDPPSRKLLEIAGREAAKMTIRKSLILRLTFDIRPSQIQLQCGVLSLFDG